MLQDQSGHLLLVRVLARTVTSTPGRPFFMVHGTVKASSAPFCRKVSMAKAMSSPVMSSTLHESSQMVSAMAASSGVGVVVDAGAVAGVGVAVDAGAVAGVGAAVDAGAVAGAGGCWSACRLFRLVFCKALAEDRRAVFCKALAEDRAHAVGCRKVFCSHAIAGGRRRH